MAIFAPYQYVKLEPGHIRLIKLSFYDSNGDPDEDDTFMCELKDYSLRAAPAYYALSYVWGESPAMFDLFLNESSNLRITYTLFKHLSFFAQALCSKVWSEKGDTSVYLWADQICINQQDDQERGEQVAIMRSIYSNASKVLIRLDDTEDGDELHVLLDRLLKADEKRNWEQCPLLNAEDRAKFEIPELESSSWEILIRLLKQPWFTRRWVIQEATVNDQHPHLFFNHRSYDWHTLYSAINQAVNGSMHLKWIREATAQYRALILIGALRSSRDSNGTYKPIALENVLCMAIGLKASRSHDYILSLLGLVRDHDLIPDYKQDIGHLLGQVVRTAINQTQTLGILALAGRHLKGAYKLLDLPSWVPQPFVDVDTTFIQTKHIT